ncbi:MAG: histidinol-phosphate transaminase [Anaerolineae bacterium]|nr:histidinol-phosphate aminotransferase family protein [Anaerolineae bacterium]MCX8067206.1 histidinol-phosphate aminotransferase family protein [Anaerolineae bacterium]MDW7990808.1 histidinol-phosphate transaminase [Anaerolineae bacterium]
MPLPRQALRELTPDQHGGIDYARLRAEGITPEEVLDFSVNSNPFGPHPAVREALACVEISRYPDPEAGLLRERLAALCGLPPAQVLVTNGTAQAIWLIALAYLDPGDVALVVGPTFGEYRVASQLMAAAVYTLFVPEEQGFRPDAAEIADQVRARRPRLVWLCNPNNPTGVYLDQGAVGAVLEACERADSLLVLDEAYVNFADSPWNAVPLLESGHLLILRSMTKDFALAGLRLGYVLGPKESIRALHRAQPPWSVNAAAQAAGLAALDHLEEYRETWRALRRVTEDLRAGIAGLGFPVLPTAVNFFLVRTGDGDGTREALARHRILVRSCRSFGLPAYIRIGTRRPEENRRFLEVLVGR